MRARQFPMTLLLLGALLAGCAGIVAPTATPLPTPTPVPTAVPPVETPPIAAWGGVVVQSVCLMEDLSGDLALSAERYPDRAPGRILAAALEGMHIRVEPKGGDCQARLTFQAEGMAIEAVYMWGVGRSYSGGSIEGRLQLVAPGRKALETRFTDTIQPPGMLNSANEKVPEPADYNFYYLFDDGMAKGLHEIWGPLAMIWLPWGHPLWPELQAAAENPNPQMMQAFYHTALSPDSGLIAGRNYRTQSVYLLGQEKVFAQNPQAIAYLIDIFHQSTDENVKVNAAIAFGHGLPHAAHRERVTTALLDCLPLEAIGTFEYIGNRPCLKILRDYYKVDFGLDRSKWEAWLLDYRLTPAP